MKNLFQYLSSNTYPGRGIIIGKTNQDEYCIAYFIMGRSVNSRNRIFVKQDDSIVIYPFDKNLSLQSELIIYTPQCVHQDKVIVTNGDQTDTVLSALKNGLTFEEALQTRTYEPDSPNYTPRISGIINVETGEYTLSILKKAPNTADCVREYFNYQAQKGYGHIIHTYNGDGNPLPTFVGAPQEISIEDNIDDFTQKVWEGLNNDNKISLFVKYVKGNETLVRIVNKNK